VTLQVTYHKTSKPQL